MHYETTKKAFEGLKKQHGLTSQQVADLMGLTVRSVQGKLAAKGNPSYEDVQLLASKLGVVVSISTEQ